MSVFEDKLRDMGCKVQAWRDAGAGADAKDPKPPGPSGDMLADIEALATYMQTIVPLPCECLACRAANEDPSVAVVVLREGEMPTRTSLRALRDGKVELGEDGTFYLIDLRFAEQRAAEPASVPLEPGGLGGSS